MAVKILTVDDSSTIRMIIKKAFRSFDCTVLSATNGVEGLAAANREKPDLILLDYTMPIMDGFEMLNKMKSDPDLKKIPVIMLTAEAGKETVMKIAKLGVRDYLIKPFKEELVVDRVGRHLELKQKGENKARIRRYDDEISIMVVDNKPAIIDQISDGIKDTKWKVLGLAQTGQALDQCSQEVPDIVCVSLALPDDAAYTLFQMLRASKRTKGVPVLGLSVKTETDEQSKALQSGFAGVITKPIDFGDLKLKVTRALQLDTSYKYFSTDSGLLCLRLPSDFDAHAAGEITAHLRPKLSEAVNSGIDKLAIDMSKLGRADLSLIKLVIGAVDLCKELSLRHCLVGSDAIRAECANYEETKNWEFVASLEEAEAILKKTQQIAA